ncbi:MAG: 50S ribosomal protein L30 [Firmicutes bacterium]|nr:50S ribosomal protein L30 [Bacillota bacterium]
MEEKKEVKKPAAKATPAKAAAPKTEKPAAKPAVAKSPAKPVAAKVPAVKKEVAPKAAPAPKAPAKKVEAPKAEKPAAKKVEKTEKPKGKAPYESNGEVTVILVGGLQGCTKRQLRTVQALGLKKIGDSKLHKDNPAIRGMIHVVAHLVKIEK